MPRLAVLSCLVVLPAVIGCAQRTLYIDSKPEGALVYLNGEEIGRTPLKYDFEWYSDYDVALRKEGYETLKTNRKIKAPLWGIPPFDLLGEAFGAKDKRYWTFEMKPEQPLVLDPAALIKSAQDLKAELRSSQYTRKPTSMPTTRPTSRPARAIRSDPRG